MAEGYGQEGVLPGFSQASSGSLTPRHHSMRQREGQMGEDPGGGKVPATGKGERRKQSCLRARSLSSQKLPGVAGPTGRKVMGRKSDSG